MKDFSWYYSIGFLIGGIILLYYQIKHDRKPKLETEETDMYQGFQKFRIYVVSIGLIIVAICSIYSEIKK
jgi:hypothetical protein